MPSSGQKHTLSSRYYRTAIQAALNALKRGDKVNAERLALRAASLGPDAEAPWLVLASLAGPEESLAYARKALQLNPESVRAQQAVEWALGRLNLQTHAAEPEEPHPLISMIETMPEMAQAPAPEPEQPPEQFGRAPSMNENIPEAVQPLEPEPEPLPEPFQPPAATIRPFPDVVQPSELEPEPLPEPFRPPAATVEPFLEVVQPSELEPEHLPEPVEPLSEAAPQLELESGEPSEPPLPPASAVETLPEAAQSVVPESEPPAERRSPLDSLPAWIDVKALPRAREPEQIQSPVSAAKKLPEVPQPVVPEPPKTVEIPPPPKQPVEQPQPPVSAAAPVKTKPFYEEPEISPDQIDLDAIIAKPAVKPPPVVARPPAPTPVKRRKEVPVFLERLVRYTLFILTVAAALTALMFMLPKITDLWARVFPSEGCSQTLVLGARTFEIRTLKPESDGSLNVPGNSSERVYWVEGTEGNYLFLLSSIPDNISFVETLKEGDIAKITWADCGSRTFSLYAPETSSVDVSTLPAQLTTGITVFLQADSSGSGILIKGDLTELIFP